jgi:hypothetical protein
MNINVEWNKIVTNSISALVVTTFLGAAAIVWRGATTVDEKVSANRADIEHLIEALSDRLSEYHMSHNQITNAIYEISQRQAVIEEKLNGNKNPFATMFPPPKGIITEPLISPPLINKENALQQSPSQNSTRQSIYNTLKR